MKQGSFFVSFWEGERGWGEGEWGEEKGTLFLKAYLTSLLITQQVQTKYNQKNLLLASFLNHHGYSMSTLLK